MCVPQVVVVNQSSGVQSGQDSGPLNVSGMKTLILGTNAPNNIGQVSFSLDTQGPDGNWYTIASNLIVNTGGNMIAAYGESAASPVPFTGTVRIRWGQSNLTLGYWLIGEY